MVSYRIRYVDIDYKSVITALINRGPVSPYAKILKPMRNFNPSMDISDHVLSKMWDKITFTKIRRLHRWNLGMENSSHSIL